jgi:hypothetical protein
MSGKRFIVPLLAALAAAAALVAQPATSAGNGVVASATGSGHASGAPVGGELRTFTFTVRKYGGGSVTGQMQVNNHAQDRFSHSTLDCLVVTGNRAYFGGTIDSSNDPTLVGTPFAVEVRDNGEGGGAPPDQITLFWYPIPAGGCANPAWQAFLDGVLFPIDSGNVQVH